jgi:large subunit ribosomal protein L7/L12
MGEKKQRRLTRRTFLRMSAVAGAAFVLAACAGTAPSPAPLAVPMEELTEFDVILVAGGENKIEVIKVVRQLTNLSLRKAQDLVDSAPTLVLQAVSKEHAAAAKAKLEEVGATVEVK